MEKQQRILEVAGEWGLENIYATRSIMNAECDKKQQSAKASIDVVAFGLSSWRQNCNDEIISLLKRKVKIRILAPQPDSDFIRQRELDEEKLPGSIKNDIEKLQEWVTTLKEIGDIELRLYSWLPMDFYFRVDDSLFIGPYMYHKQSQQTVSYEYSANGQMFNIYTAYFENIWKLANTTKQ